MINKLNRLKICYFDIISKILFKMILRSCVIMKLQVNKKCDEER